MVCGCSWSMKIAERSSAMVSAPAPAARRGSSRGGRRGWSEAAPAPARAPGARSTARDRRSRRAAPRGGDGARSHGPGPETAEAAEGLVAVVREPRPLGEVLRLQVLGQRRAAEEARADG